MTAEHKSTKVREGEDDQVASLARLVQAIGDCAVELAAGSLRVAGELTTDVAASLVSPCDRLFGTHSEEDDKSRQRRRRDRLRIGRAINRAVNSAADVVERSQGRFVEGIREAREEPGTPGGKP